MRHEQGSRRWMPPGLLAVELGAEDIGAPVGGHLVDLDGGLIGVKGDAADVHDWRPWRDRQALGLPWARHPGPEVLTEPCRGMADLGETSVDARPRIELGDWGAGSDRRWQPRPGQQDRLAVKEIPVLPPISAHRTTVTHG